MPPVDFDPTEAGESAYLRQGAQPQPPQEKWIAKLTINLTRISPGIQQTERGPVQAMMQRGAITQEELGEGGTPGEAYRAAREKLKPIMRAYKLETGPLPIE